MSDDIIVDIDEDLEDLVPMFLEGRREDIETIKEKLEGGDFETVRVLGHNMKGSGGGYGFERISEMGEVIEAMAKEGNKERILQELTALLNYLDSVKINYVEV